MLFLPPDPVPGQPVSASTITAILRYLRSITPRSSGTNRVQVGAGGATHHPILPRPRPSSTASPPIDDYPWKPYVAPYTGEGPPPPGSALKIRLEPGNVNNANPSNMTTVFTLPPNQGSDGGQGPDDGSVLFWLHATVNWTSDSGPRLGELTIEQGGSVPSDDTSPHPEDIYKLLLAIETGPTAITNVVQFTKTSFSLTFPITAFDCTSTIQAPQWSGA